MFCVKFSRPNVLPYLAPKVVKLNFDYHEKKKNVQVNDTFSWHILTKTLLSHPWNVISYSSLRFRNLSARAQNVLKTVLSDSRGFITYISGDNPMSNSLVECTTSCCLHFIQKAKSKKLLYVNVARKLQWYGAATTFQYMRPRQNGTRERRRGRLLASCSDALRRAVVPLWKRTARDRGRPCPRRAEYKKSCDAFLRLNDKSECYTWRARIEINRTKRS